MEAFDLRPRGLNLDPAIRAEILTGIVASRTADGKTVLLHREPHAAWIQYGKIPPGLAARFTGGIISLCIHLVLIAISLGLWLVVLLLIGLSEDTHTFRVEIISVNESGGIDTQTATGRQGKRIAKTITRNTKR